MTAPEIATKLVEFYHDYDWTFGSFARTKNGTMCYYQEAIAVQFCIAGAMWKLGMDMEEFNVLEEALGRSVIGASDCCKNQDEVLDLLNEIIVEEES